jgi:hypothetical protein
MTAALCNDPMGGRFPSVMAISCLIVSMLTVQAHGTIIATYTGPADTIGEVGREFPMQAGEETHGQSFTSTHSLQLTSIEIEMRRYFTRPGVSTVIVSLYNTSGGLPTGSPLAAQSRLYNDFTFDLGVLYSFDFTANNIVLTAGTEYAFDVGTNGNGGSPSDAPIAVRYDTTGTYAGGETFHNTGTGAGYFALTGGDVVFTVNAVPEPSSVLLLLIGGIGVFLRRKRG